MVVKFYSIKDTKSGFMAPVSRQSDELVKRDFINQIRSSEPNFLNTNPEDYELWCIAEFDTLTGIVTPKLEHVCSALLGGSNNV